MKKMSDTKNFADRNMYSKRNLWAGILFGLGLVAFFDETVFNQLLHWHHFYDRSTTAAGLVSDGWFHAFSWFATVGGLFKEKGEGSRIVISTFTRCSLSGNFAAPCLLYYGHTAALS